MANLLQPKNAEKFIQQAMDISEITASDADSISFMAKVLVQATLPHRDPGNVPAWGRQNGNYSLTIQPGVRWVDGKPKTLGLPYGSIPRLLMAWVSTEATQTKSNKLILGKSLSEFMRSLDLVPTGGRWGTISRLKEQMIRLFSARIMWQYDSSSGHVGKDTQITTERMLWWDEKHPEQTALFENYIVLDEKFYRSIIKNPVPIDMRALKALKQSPLALDYYIWLTYRMSYLAEETAIPWSALKQQFGTDYKNVDEFARKSKEAIRRIKLVYPNLKLETPRGRLILQPSQPHVERKVRILTDKDK